MTYLPTQSGNAIEHVNNQALSKAIGERLQINFDQQRTETSPHLVSLLKQLRLNEVESDAR
jgi:hypothetical protein